MWRWLAAFVVILLAVVWFMNGDDLFGGETTDVQAAGGGMSRGPAATDTRPAAVVREGKAPRTVVEVPLEPSARDARAEAARIQPTLKNGRDGSTAGDERTSSSVDATLAEARRRADRGDARGAEAAAREAMTQATSAWEKGRCALTLATCSSDPGERRKLLGFALAQGAVRGAEYDDVSRQLRELNHQPGSLSTLLDVAKYTVRANDNLWTLCNKTFPESLGASPEVGLVQLLNGMSTDRLQVGQTLLVPRERLRIEIDRRERGLVAYLGDIVLVAYRVGLGKDNRTPHGAFVVQVKQKEPTWYRAGKAIPFGEPENILGTRWMGFENTPDATGYGIHGTASPETIGSDESMGCIRMRNEEVEELFELVPRGTIVTIP